MKAITKYSYGGPEVLQLEEIPTVTLGGDDQVVVQVHANSANPADWHIMRGSPYFARFMFGLLRPKVRVLGADFAGVVTAVGPQVTDFRVGDRVFGECLQGGAFAEYVTLPQHGLGCMPDSSSFTEMAALPIAGLTALQAIVREGKVQAGEKVLINGASGGVGHLAVQMAKAQGAEVTGVCSSRNKEFVLTLGADQVIAYDEVSIHQLAGSYDLILDTIGNLYLSDYVRLGRRGVVIGFTTLGHMASVSLKNMVRRYPLIQFTAHANTADLNTLAEMYREGKLRPHIDKEYPYTEIPQAIGYIEAMRTRGKVVMSWEGIN